jgi:creatinine amidohydrolase
MMGTVRWGELTAEEIRSAGLRNALAVVPLGCTEQHGFHLPVDTDTYQVERLVTDAAGLAAASGVEVLILPTLPFGPASEHFGYPGTISLDSSIYVQLVKAIVHSVVDSGFRRISVVHGCGGHWVVPGALWDVKSEAARMKQSVVIRHLPVDREWSQLQRDIFPESSDAGIGHAGVMETALCLAGREHLVRLTSHRSPTLDRFDERYGQFGEVFLFSEITDTGALGDATGATVEGGMRLWAQAIDRLAEVFVELARQDGVATHADPPPAR